MQWLQLFPMQINFCQTFPLIQWHFPWENSPIKWNCHGDKWHYLTPSTHSPNDFFMGIFSYVQGLYNVGLICMPSNRFQHALFGKQNWGIVHCIVWAYFHTETASFDSLFHASRKKSGLNIVGTAGQIPKPQYHWVGAFGIHSSVSQYLGYKRLKYRTVCGLSLLVWRTLSTYL